MEQLKQPLAMTESENRAALAKSERTASGREAKREARLADYREREREKIRAAKAS